jgi:hypothetical protein
VAPALTAILAVVSLAALGLILAAPIQPGVAFNTNLPVSAQYTNILVRNGTIKALTIVLNIYGTLTLVGGAILSAYLFWRKRVLANRMVGNILIAAGALMPALAGSFIKAGLADWLYVSELLGVVLMYTGFLQATAAQAVRVKVASSAPVN